MRSKFSSFYYHTSSPTCLPFEPHLNNDESSQLTFFSNPSRRWIRKALNLEHSRKGSWSEAAVARAEFHLSLILKQQRDKNDDDEDEEAAQLAASARKVLAKLLPLDPLPSGVVVKEEDELALFDHLQPVFDGRFTGRAFLGYVGQR